MARPLLPPPGLPRDPRRKPRPVPRPTPIMTICSWPVLLGCYGNMGCQVSKGGIKDKIDFWPRKFGTILLIDTSSSSINMSQCPRTDLGKRYLPKPMTTTG